MRRVDTFPPGVTSAGALQVADLAGADAADAMAVQQVGDGGVGQAGGADVGVVRGQGKIR